MSRSPRGDRSPISSPETRLVCVGPPVVFALPTLTANIEATTPSGGGGLFLECSVRLRSCKGAETRHTFYWQSSVTGTQVAPLTLSAQELSDRFTHPPGRVWHRVTSYEAAREILDQHLAEADDVRKFITLTINDTEATARFVDLLRKQSSKCMIVLRNPIQQSSAQLAASPGPLFPK